MTNVIPERTIAKAEAEAKRKLVVLGNGTHAKVVIEILEAMDCFEILGCSSSDPDPPLEVCGYPFLGDFEVLRELSQDGVRSAATGIGGWTDNTFRKEVFDRVTGMGYQFVCAVHPTAIVAPNVRIGEGTMIGSRNSPSLRGFR